MKVNARLTKSLGRLCQIIGAAILCLWLSLMILENFTAEPISKLVSARPVLAAPPVISTTHPRLLPKQSASNPVAGAFIDAVPFADGTSILVSASGVTALEAPVFVNLFGPASHRCADAMTISDTTYIATIGGFAPNMDSNDSTLSLTTTVGSEVVSTGEIDFHRAFVETANPKFVSVDNDNFRLEIHNTDSFSDDIYVLVMSTNAPPGALPPGYQLVSETYNVRPSGALTESKKPMALNLRFQEPLPGGSDPHTLSIVSWGDFNQTGELLGGDLLNDNNLLTLAINRFRIYALATTPIWRDSFQEFSLTGVSERRNTQPGPGQTIILQSGAVSGTVTSIPITPTGASTWDTLHFSVTTSFSTGLTVDLLDLNDALVATNLSDGTDLSHLSVSAYPSLKLRATLTSTVAGESPRLHDWEISWSPKPKIYLPFVLR